MDSTAAPLFQKAAFCSRVQLLCVQKLTRGLHSWHQVALMFLVTADVFHEPTWKLWFQEAEGLIPSYLLREDPEWGEPFLLHW